MIKIIFKKIQNDWRFTDIERQHKKLVPFSENQWLIILFFRFSLANYYHVTDFCWHFRPELMLMDDMISIGRSEKAGRIAGKILGSEIIHKSFDGANGELRFQTLNFDPAVFFYETSSITVA